MLTNVMNVDQDALQKLLRFNIKRGSNLIMIGPSGCGKTEMTQQIAEELGYECGYLNLSVLEAPDITGLPMIDKETRITTYATPEFLPLAEGNDDKPIVLMADELDKALPELQNPCLEMFQFRTINGRKLNIHAIVATGNRPDENAHSNPVSHALTNRCKVYSVDPRFDPWLEWAIENGVNGLITMFLDKNKDYFLKPDESGDPTAYCHPTPRAWTRAAEDLDKLRSQESDLDFQQIVVAGWVGSDASTKFRVWLEHYKDIQPMIDKWLNHGVYPKPESPDQVMVCCVSGLNELADACRQTPTNDEERKLKKKNIARLVEYVCNYLSTISEDFITGSVRATLTRDMINQNDLKDHSAFSGLFSKICKAWADHDIDIKVD